MAEYGETLTLLEQYIIAQLVADTTIAAKCSDRVFHQHPPDEGPTYPCITVEQSDAIPHSVAPAQLVLMGLNIYAKNADADNETGELGVNLVKTLEGRVYYVLNKIRFETVGGLKCRRVIKDGGHDEYDKEDDLQIHILRYHFVVEDQEVRDV